MSKEHLVTRLRDMRELLAVLNKQGESLARDTIVEVGGNSTAPGRMSYALSHLSKAILGIDDVTAEIECGIAIDALPADASDEEYNATCARFSGRRAA